MSTLSCKPSKPLLHQRWTLIVPIARYL
uniref:Uncharacterized protein n=1 Tax=Rhizophora mucronata TaxID=61149 RepID=A0A2P2IRV5_RHIMU